MPEDGRGNTRIMRVLVILAAFAALVSAGPGASSTATTPSLRVLDREPLAIRGTGFAARERVVVSARTQRGTISRRLVTSQLGTFTVRYELAFGTCTGVRTVLAVGARSGTATLRALPMTRECPPPAP